MDSDLCSASLVYWPLKELYNTRDSHTWWTLMGEAAHQQQYVVQYPAQGYFDRNKESKQTWWPAFFFAGFPG